MKHQGKYEIGESRDQEEQAEHSHSVRAPGHLVKRESVAEILPDQGDQASDRGKDQTCARADRTVIAEHLEPSLMCAAAVIVEQLREAAKVETLQADSAD